MPAPVRPGSQRSTLGHSGGLQVTSGPLVGHHRLTGAQVKTWVVDMNQLPDCKVQQLLRGLEVLGTFQHPNILSLLGVVEEAHCLLVLEEQAQGQDLATLLLQRPVLAEAKARSLLRQITFAVQCCHRRDLSLGDLNTQYVLVTEEGRVKLSVVEALMGSVGVALDVAWGQPVTMAPEVLLGQRPSTASDLWCLGVLLYKMTLGNLPFLGKDYTVEEDKILRGALHMPYSTPFILRHLLSRLLHQDPRQRGTTQDILRHPWTSHVELVTIRVRPKGCPQEEDGPRCPAETGSALGTAIHSEPTINSWSWNEEDTEMEAELGMESQTPTPELGSWNEEDTEMEAELGMESQTPTTELGSWNEEDTEMEAELGMESQTPTPELGSWNEEDTEMEAELGMESQTPTPELGSWNEEDTEMEAELGMESQTPTPELGSWNEEDTEMEAELGMESQTPTPELGSWNEEDTEMEAELGMEAQTTTPKLGSSTEEDTETEPQPGVVSSPSVTPEDGSSVLTPASEIPDPVPQSCPPSSPPPSHSSLTPPPEGTLQVWEAAGQPSRATATPRSRRTELCRAISNEETDASHSWNLGRIQKETLCYEMKLNPLDLYKTWKIPNTKSHSEENEQKSGVKSPNCKVHPKATGIETICYWIATQMAGTELRVWKETHTNSDTESNPEESWT
ncbi:sperm motility kinase X-like [Erinaceus europaeus]|uniref:non-specific serine/threonine protein kinase n=1 Tax=Erinaceus europaeus TaxID=9365 RepID=A0ABM3X6L0_ERIEU|nr:sperm motility kinase X-like [Erinaceus europaeus]